MEMPKIEILEIKYSIGEYIYHVGLFWLLVFLSSIFLFLWFIVATVIFILKSCFRYVYNVLYNFFWGRSSV